MNKYEQRWIKNHKKFIHGAIVTTTESVPAYYSGYGITPICNFEPGDIGVIAEVAVPCVRTINGKSREFACVDYWKDGLKWRTSLFIEQMRKVK